MWNPDVYLSFADHRGRPFFELLSRVGVQAPRRVVDLGCGPGNLTVTLRERFPDAVVDAVDSSPEMVSAAVALGLNATLGSIVDWVPEPDTDLVVSNAALQWVPDHVALMLRWVGELPTGAWLAVQVPGNFDAPSHCAVQEVALRPQFADRLRDIRFGSPHLVETPEGYADVLTLAGCDVDAWETTYVQILTGDTPVLDWITGTALTDVRDRLPDSDWHQYRRQIIPLLADAYPKRADGTTFFPFRRIFVVARTTT